jgi:3-hydroxy-9,10-secoandrosta-1,3,5(10)-triene-9,17-dione monooxygenase reductase component
VAVVTAINPDPTDGRHAGEPVGFACQSFAALSLEPPLVLFCPSRTSRTWPIIERAGSFCVNVLADSQRELSTVFGKSGAEKFANLNWSPAPSGAPRLGGVLAWIDCSVDDVHEAGDHYVVIGRVHSLGEHGDLGEQGDLGEHGDGGPLLFYRGAYAEISAGLGSPPVVDDALDAFLTWSHSDDWV